MDRTKRRRSGRSLPLVLAVAGLLATSIMGPARAWADDAKPVGVIDSNRIVQEYDAARDALEAHEKFVKDLENELEDKERELQRLAEEIESQKMLLSEDKLAERMQEFENKRDGYFEFQKQSQDRAQAEYKEKIGPIIDQVRTVAERIGKEEHFGVIIDAASLTVLYLDSSVDLTDKVLAALVRGED
jgi:outer membrane protein